MSASAWGAELFLPKDKSVVRADGVFVLGKAEPGAQIPLRIETTKDVREGAAKAKSQGEFYFIAPLAPGLNRLEVAGQKREVFSVQAEISPPVDFLPERLHGGSVTECEDCHEANLQLRSGGYPDLCLGCHPFDTGDPEGTGSIADDRHFRTAGARCGACHDPHGATDPKLLLGSSGSLCGKCHGTFGGGAGIHPAFEEGGCVACHEPHFSGLPYNLLQDLPRLCHECHEQGEGIDAKNLHPPVSRDKSCSTCHDPHAAGGALLREALPGVCISCHSGVLTQGHGGELGECNTCHDPHGALGTGLGRGEFADHCAECHEAIADGENVHPALDEGCEACHAPHSDRILDEARGSCPECHSLAEDAGLASVHGELPVPAEACPGCHRPHASKRPALLRGKLHEPLTESACSACHGEGADRSLSIGAVAEACRECHGVQEDLATSGVPMHDPVAEGECTACHNPHLSERQDLLREREALVCRECHELPVAGGDVEIHSAAEACSDCHNPHGSATASFLRATPPDLCFRCHEDPAETPGQVHPALEEGCLTCHDPHGGARPAVLTRPETELCLDCHDDPAAGLPYRHGALGAGCSGCHEPHASEKGRLLRASLGELCLGCHEVSVPNPGRSLHPPVEDCSDCHQGVAHGGQRPRSLSALPPDLCLDCHEDPREAEGELHPALEEGCVICHDPHQGFAPGLLGGESPRSVCLECHEDPLVGRSVTHPPAEQGCSACHEPHVSGAAHFLRQPGNALCLGCHDVDAHAHSLDAEVGVTRFPTSAEFPRSGDQYACTGCHSPHGSEEKGMFARGRSELCVSCHKL